MNILAIVINALALLLAFVGTGLMVVLGYMFLGSYVRSDKMDGIVIFVFAAVLFAAPIIGLWLATRQGNLWPTVSVVTGSLALLVQIVAIIILPAAIEAAARP